jgi:hypothetical protein
MGAFPGNGPFVSMYEDPHQDPLPYTQKTAGVPLLSIANTSVCVIPTC